MAALLETKLPAVASQSAVFSLGKKGFLVESQTNLAQMRLSHWSLGFWVGDDDSDTRQYLFRNQRQNINANI